MKERKKNRTTQASGFGWYKRLERQAVECLNRWFNGLSARIKRVVLICFGSATGCICLTIIMQAISGKTNQIISVENISQSKDLYMQEESKPHDDQLIPLGKMKGEINARFDSFYVAIDRNARIYINRNIRYSAEAYRMENGWEQISKEQLEEYRKSLHFLPAGKQNKKSIKP